MGITLTPSTGKPGSTFRVRSNCKANTPTLIKVGGVVVAPSFKSDSSGFVQKDLKAPNGAAGTKILVAIEQKTTISGVTAWRQISGLEFTLSGTGPVVQPPPAPSNFKGVPHDGYVDLSWS